MEDMREHIIRTPCDPDITFSDDPLRMMRAVRFAAQLGFDIAPETFEAIERNRERIRIVSRERIITEINKIVLSPVPSIGFELMDMTGLLPHVFPEMSRLKGVEKVGLHGHKDNFTHTLKVLDNVHSTATACGSLGGYSSRYRQAGNESLRPAAGWTFHGHEVVGARMVPDIFRRMKLPLNDRMKYVRKLVLLHLRPQILSDDVVTDSAVRRLLFEAGDDIDDLMTLCEADITSGDERKVKRYLKNFAVVRRKLREIEEKDRVRNFQPPVSGELIMETYGIPPCRIVGEIKDEIKEAILDGRIANDYGQAYAMMEELAARHGLKRRE